MQDVLALTCFIHIFSTFGHVVGDMHGPDIDPRRIRTLMGFQREGPLSGVYIMRGGDVGGEHSYATNPSSRRPSSPCNPS
jgi:hypothetical protein